MNNIQEFNELLGKQAKGKQDEILDEVCEALSNQGVPQKSLKALINIHEDQYKCKQCNIVYTESELINGCPKCDLNSTK